MKLQEFSVTNPVKHVNKVFESYFGGQLNVDRLDRRQANIMLSRVRGLLSEHRGSTERHWAERNPTYLKLMMMEQALTQRVKENIVPPAGQASLPGQAGQPTKPGQPKPAVAGAAAKDPKLAAALKKSQAGQTLNPEEQKMVAGAAMMAQESRLRRAYRMLKESEVQQAQVVLAAQDMVDKMQGMLEDVSELQFKELPALVDSIKNQVGIDQATQFNADASAALSGLLQNIQGTKQQLDAALGVVTGQPGSAPDLAALGADAGADAGAELGAAAGAELGADVGDATDDLDAAADLAAGQMDDEEVSPSASLGRQRR
jgi:hypothetical protein